MPGKSLRDTLKIPVKPFFIDVTDIHHCHGDPRGYTIVPYYYDCSIRFSGYAISKLVHWAIRQGYIKLSGELTYKAGKHWRRHNDTDKEETNEKVRGSSVPAPDENH